MFCLQREEALRGGILHIRRADVKHFLFGENDI